MTVARTLPPELDDAQYCATVLRLPADQTESQLNCELLARAGALGINAALPDFKRGTSLALSHGSSASTSHEQLFSTASDASASAYLTPHSSIFGPPSPDAAAQPGNCSFAPYEKLLGVALGSFKSARPFIAVDSSAKSIFSVSTRKSLAGLRSRITLRRKPSRFFEPSMSCLSCQNDCKASLHLLPCGHAYCADCLRLKIDQASVDESMMPPQCCQPIPASSIQALVGPAAQEVFLRAVIQFSTPREKRLYCPSATCREFIPRRKHVDPKAPFAVTCHKCHGRVCTICKRDAHPIGKDCPDDLEVEESPKTEGRPSRKRCYKCRGLVERTRDSSHLTCACKAHFCSACGGVWDPTVGCPNICNGEEEAGRRRSSGDGTATGLDGLDAAAAAEEREAAEQRSAQHADMQSLQRAQAQEMQRFCAFEAEAMSAARERQSEQKTATAQMHHDQEVLMKERHAKEAALLEDRQIKEEMELRTALDQSERSIKVRIKHMEAYCEGLGRHPTTSDALPPRVVTEQNLRDLGRQYNLRDDLERQHQAKINMMRDRQAKKMEDLLQRQEEELEKLADKQRADKQELETGSARDNETASSFFQARRSRLAARWTLAIEVLCKELQQRDGARYAPVVPPSWPDADKTDDDDDDGDESPAGQESTAA